MTDLNHVALIGRLTRDLGTDERSFAYLPNGTARANVSVAVNRSRRGADGSWSDEVSYFDITIWGKTAENLKPYLLKGKQIAIDGYLRQDRWEKDGKTNSRVNIVANNVQLLGGKGEGAPSGSDLGGTPRFQPRPQQPAQNFNDAPYPADDGGFPEDIPF
ncbi:MAG: single-stranded DNA-binding protein [Treponema sp.]|nr:single-stranded DNA-binding protein [Treponema sp.]